MPALKHPSALLNPTSRPSPGSPLISRSDCPAEPWQKTTWHTEPAWSSCCGAVRAVVSETRQRLVYFGAEDSSRNLINAPRAQTAMRDQSPWPNQGGHRFWLGPQRTWQWPPPAEWEFSSATAVRCDNHALCLVQAQLDRRYPGIERAYSWEGGRLRCTARWRDNGTPFFGMHVIAIDLPFSGCAELRPTEATPLGLVQVSIEETRTRDFLPSPAVRIDGVRAEVFHGLTTLKLGFAIQPLTIARPGGWQLSLDPGPATGLALDPPDFGCLSQIWVGGPDYDFAEIEQLTPYLRAGPDGFCASTVYLAARPPSGHP